MSNIWRIFKKEFGGYINSPSSYIFLIIFHILGTSMFFFVSGFFRNQQANLGGFFVFMPWLMLFFVPAVAMRIWAEEKKVGTDELLMTLPVKDYEVVLGKYLAALVLVALALILTFPVVLVVKYFADPHTPVDWGPIWCGYLGSLLMGASFLAMGVWASSLTRNQIIAFIISCAVGFVLILIGFPFIYQVLPGGEILARFSLYSHFLSLYRGVLDLADVVYYLSAIAFFLFLNIRSVESRKWK
ncbi:MAG: ABC transporter permease [Candidatus Sumerlaea chitinivorans]|nr:ABC transporter permease [Candidatus Sumerlaea chitinivorans]